MDFDEIDQLSRKARSLPQGCSLEEIMCSLSLRHLYSEYRRGNIRRDDASQEKRCIRRSYQQAVEDRDRQMAMYRQYQENIRLAQDLRGKLVKGARDGQPVLELMELACRIIAAMTGEDVTSKLTIDWVKGREARYESENPATGAVHGETA